MLAAAGCGCRRFAASVASNRCCQTFTLDVCFATDKRQRFATSDEGALGCGSFQLFVRAPLVPFVGSFVGSFVRSFGVRIEHVASGTEGADTSCGE